MDDCDATILKIALERTSTKRGSIDTIRQWENVIPKIESSEFLRDNWMKYCNTNAFAEGISYEQTCESLKKLMELVTE